MVESYVLFGTYGSCQPSCMQLLVLKEATGLLLYKVKVTKVRKSYNPISYLIQLTFLRKKIENPS